MSFVHLHTHTSYSLLDGEGTVKKILDRAKELGQNSMAITDHGNMYGVIEFYEYAKSIGIHPVLGCEVYVAARSRFDKIHEFDAQSSHLILLAENDIGYKNLMKLVSYGFTEGFYYKPRVDIELLKEYHEGIIALSGCMFGVISRKIIDDNLNGAREMLETFISIFGRENFFIEIQDHGIYEQKKLNMALISLAREYGLGLVATNDIHYVKKDDAVFQDILMCIQMGKKVDDSDRMKMESEELYVKSETEMSELFSYVPEAIENTEKIAKRCQVDIEFGKLHLPKFDIPEGKTSFMYLKELCLDGYKKRYKSDNSNINRLEYELDTIKNMGYVDYFLIVRDFVNYAKANGIMVGPGRGSAAGSIVSYCLGITDIDPIKYDLIFERFLNPERVTMPDIDIDFCYERRGEVIDYVNKKYGTDRVAQIVTFGTMAARLAVRDVGRALDMPYAFVDKVAKLIPRELNITIESALKSDKELKLLYDTDSSAKKLIDTAAELEGLPRHTSTHAAGVVITNEPVVNYVPLQSNDNIITTQFTMTTIERLGLLKMDFLGLRTLTVIRDAVKNIELSKGTKIDINCIDMNDSNVYGMISKGETDGVFQLESVGMKEFMKELCPENIEDIIAGISLYRPGPMDSIPKYVQSKHDSSKIRYKHPALENILNVTYGCIVYQEQVMQIVRELGGYSLGRADLVRRAMSKKKTDVMLKEKHNFVYGSVLEDGSIEIEGAVRRGIDAKIAEEIFDEMMDFAKYAFNKSHAAAYAYISYQTAWLKCHYSTEFFAALLTSVFDKTSQVTKYIGASRENGIDILPPDVNLSIGRFFPDGENIRFGLSAIKGVGSAFVNSLVSERNKNGIFVTFSDFCSRMAQYKLNKRIAEALIKAGAFDSMGYTRATLLLVFDNVIDNALKEGRNGLKGQIDIFSLFEEEQSSDKENFIYKEEFDKNEILKFEKEYLGIYVSGHPLEKYTDYIAANSQYSVSDILENENGRFDSGDIVTIYGMIGSIKRKLTKKNDTMLYLTFEDITAGIEVLVFPSQVIKNQSNIYEGAFCQITGRLDISEDMSAKLLLEKCEPFSFSESKTLNKLYIRINTENESFVSKLSKILENNNATIPIYLYYENKKQTLLAPESIRFSGHEDELKTLRLTFGNENVKVV